MSNKSTIENYNPVTMSYPQYQSYLASGNNAIDASGGVSTSQIGPGGVVLGNVRQNAFTAGNNRMVSSSFTTKPINSNTAGLSWL